MGACDGRGTQIARMRQRRPRRRLDHVSEQAAPAPLSARKAARPPDHFQQPQADQPWGPHTCTACKPAGWWRVGDGRQRVSFRRWQRRQRRRQSSRLAGATACLHHAHGASRPLQHHRCAAERSRHPTGLPGTSVLLPRPCTGGGGSGGAPPLRACRLPPAYPQPARAQLSAPGRLLLSCLPSQNFQQKLKAKF